VASVGMQPGDTIDVRFTKWGGGVVRSFSGAA
jgi:hypothetical protein